ncbi:hypothetical protein [Methylococcus geothermalis]|uniref:Uncharacterized protein n=1 Tax=Methylococcus geothermalis TaxID=2681310 RepID=A0A858Q7X1_9GAMM|nr:hypothetical protein [Methylococcus geothermalis]QJD29874.1 hypothetical protein GNH96_07725 [Methylococcus geothermalis]
MPADFGLLAIQRDERKDSVCTQRLPNNGEPSGWHASALARRNITASRPWRFASVSSEPPNSVGFKRYASHPEREVIAANAAWPTAAPSKRSGWQAVLKCRAF